MKPSNVCLPKSEIPLLFSGDLTPDEVAAAESHLAECEACRGAIESMIADSSLPIALRPTSACPT